MYSQFYKVWKVNREFIFAAFRIWIDVPICKWMDGNLLNKQPFSWVKANKLSEGNAAMSAIIFKAWIYILICF